MNARAAAAALFVKYAAVGAVGTAGHYLTLIALVELAHVPPTPASALGAVAGGIINYLLNRRLTYGTRLPHRATLPRFAATAVAGVLFNAALMAALAQWWGMNYLLAQCLATVSILVITFIVNTAWTFKTTRS